MIGVGLNLKMLQASTKSKFPYFLVNFLLLLCLLSNFYPNNQVNCEESKGTGTILNHTNTSSSSCQLEEEDADVKFFDITLSPTLVPGSLTTYVCQNIQIPVADDREFHAIGFLPLIRNPDIVHHMILFGCQQPHSRPIHHCGQGDNVCRNFLVQWSRGIEGAICNHRNAGTRFGLGSFKSMMLQVHWNNENHETSRQDSSGFRVFYTSTLRPNDLGNVQVGQNRLEIPPLRHKYLQTGSCSAQCTSSKLQHPIYLTRAHIHMHNVGNGGSIEIIRQDTSLVSIVNDTSYDYNQPPAHAFTTPVKILPGDEIRVTCQFNTKDGKRQRNRTTYWGEGSDAEMCYAFISYYPSVKGFNQCIQYANNDICPPN